MTESGVSKKLFIVALCVQTIAQVDAAPPLARVILVAIICVVYKLVQGFIDWSANNGTETKAEDADGND